MAHLDFCLIHFNILTKINMILVLFSLLSINCTKNNVDLNISADFKNITIHDVTTNRCFTIRNDDTTQFCNILDTLDKIQNNLVQTSKHTGIYQKGISFKVDSTMLLFQLHYLISKMGEHGIGNFRQPVFIDTTKILFDFDMFLVMGDLNNERYPLSIFPKIVLKNNLKYDYTPVFDTINSRYSIALDVIIENNITLNQFLVILKEFNLRDYQSVRLHKQQSNL